MLGVFDGCCTKKVVNPSFMQFFDERDDEIGAKVNVSAKGGIR